MPTAVPHAQRLVVLLALAGAATAQEADFQRDVLPLLADRCFPCHGPDEEGRAAHLRLDRREDAFADRGGYAAVVPGDAAASELIARVTSEFDFERMPPPGSNLALADDEVALLRAWVEGGATWREHWAFVPPARPEVPDVAGATDLARGAIDRFVLARLRAEGIEPTGDARPEALLRRVTLDLTGLPPTPGELDAFVADPSDEAYERAVDRLLASPRYGERMAWEWLDAARYADTDGFQADPTREMWPWRDWLVDALNRNVPFDELTLAMLAGDLFADATDEDVLGTAFHRNHTFNGEGGRIAEETRVENVFDRVETTATVWLGLTVGCARCHDHRFDPISQAEYYALFDLFNQTSETGRGGNGRAAPTLSYLTPEERARLGAIRAEAERVDGARRAPDVAWDAAQATWEAELRERLAARPALGRAAELGPWWSAGPFAPPDGDAGSLFAHAFAPEGPVGPDVALWNHAPDLVDGEPFETSAEVGATYFQRAIVAPTARRMELSFGSDDAIRVWVDGVEVLGRDVRRGVAPDQDRVTVDLAPGRHGLLVKIVNTGGRGGVYFRRVSEVVEGLPLSLVDALHAPPGERSAAEAERLMERFRGERVPEWAESEARIASLEDEARALREGAREVMVMDALPPDSRRTTRVLERGGYDAPLGAVGPGTPAFLHPFPADAPRDRLGLARWIVAPDNPLTARVVVNRHWQTFFGRGLVSTSEDFGRQGEPPSHPALLDWLATGFVRGGWDVKALHRSIVTSATYRRSAVAAPGAYEADPDNVLLARGPRRRLPSWMLRDQALALGGRLVERLGGPPVRPEQPAGVWAEATFGTIRYEADEGESRYRRSLYVFWRRIVAPTFFFDGAKRQVCEVRREVTNSPLHALVTLNEPSYVDAALGFARRAWGAGADAPARIAWAFRAATSRRPDAEELDVLIARWSASRQRYGERPGDAAALARRDGADLPPDACDADLAALTVVCSILLNLDEVVSSP